jgi:hypothetical protein
MGLPADFLIGSDGVILAAKYGAYVDDHWSADDLLALRNPTSTSRPRTRREWLCVGSLSELVAEYPDDPAPRRPTK